MDPRSVAHTTIALFLLGLHTALGLKEDCRTNRTKKVVQTEQKKLGPHKHSRLIIGARIAHSHLGPPFVEDYLNIENIAE